MAATDSSSISDVASPLATILDFTTVNNIKSLILVTLNLKQPNFKKRKHFFLITVRCFSLQGFLDGITKPKGTDDEDRRKIDFLLKNLDLRYYR